MYEFKIDFVNKIYVDGFTDGESNFSKAFDLFRKLKLEFIKWHFYLR